MDPKDRPEPPNGLDRIVGKLGGAARMLLGHRGQPDVHARFKDRGDKAGLLNRLKRIEGQVRGVARMIEDDRYCVDVLTQLQAIRAALTRVEGEMLKAHLGHCIETAIVSGDKAEQRRKAAELIELLERAAR